MRGMDRISLAFEQRHMRIRLMTTGRQETWTVCL